MKNPRLILIGLSALCVAASSLFTGCGTPAQNIATGTYLAGNAFATYELGQNPASLKGLQDFAAALPSIPLGKVTPFQMGVLNAEIQPLNAAAAADSKNAAAYNQIGALISAAAQANAGATGGNPTMNTGIAIAALTDFANGLNHGIQFWQGQQSAITINGQAVTVQPVPAPSAPAAQPAAAVAQ